MGKQVFLGVVDRNKGIDIPWRGTNVTVEHSYEPEQNLLVTLEINDNTICAEVVSVELPTLLQLKQMKDELSADWARFDSIFQTASLAQKVLMLKALNQVIVRQNYINYKQEK